MKSSDEIRVLGVGPVIMVGPVVQWVVVAACHCYL
jgi:hypothetical protein